MKKTTFRFTDEFPLARLLPVSALAGLMTLAGCAAPTLIVPAKLEFEHSPQVTTSGILGDGKVQQTYTESDTPKPPPMRTGNVPAASKQPVVIENGPSDLSVSFDQMPLPTFIHAVYGSVLKANYSVDPAVTARTDLVTFRTSKPQTAAQMGNLARMLLKSYGISVQDFGGVIRILPDNATNSYNPLIRRGRASPDTAASLRPIFHYIELEAVRIGDFSGFMSSMFGTRVTMQPDTARNAVILSGQPEDVAAALEVIAVFDQPTMRGQRSKRVTPVFSTAEEFSRRLAEILNAEGYVASNTITAGTPILILPIPPLNSVIIFASSEAVLNHTLRWAKELDQPSASQANGAYFTYPVKYADAQLLAKTLGELINTPTSVAPAAGSAASAPRGASRIVVNNATNSLIIKGGGPDEYRQWMTLLAELDKPTKSAMIDVVVAEVNLNATSSLGFDWAFRDGTVRPANNLNGIITSARMNANGLNLNFLNAANLIRGALNTLATDGNARILSSPKIMARNGETATITVGDEVPIITSTISTALAAPGASSGTSTLNTVQYRSTGVILKVRPVINSGNRIDIEISQEVSEASSTQTGVTNSPTISTRRVDTKLSLKDGATVMLAGMIKNKSDNSDSGVPLLKDIPLLGNVFKSESRSNQKTEMIILITPYVINDDYEAEAITEAFQNSLGEWAKGLRERSLRSKRLTSAESLTTDKVKATSDREPRNNHATTTSPATGAKTEPVPRAPEPRVENPASTAPATPTATSTAPPGGKANETDGVTMSKPTPAPAPASTPATPPTTTSAPTKPGALPAPGARPSAPIPRNMRPVQDENLLEELRRAVERSQ